MYQGDYVASFWERQECLDAKWFLLPTVWASGFIPARSDVALCPDATLNTATFTLAICFARHAVHCHICLRKNFYAAVVKRDTDRKLNSFRSLDVPAHGCSLCPCRTVRSITFSLAVQQHKAIRAVAQMNVIHTQCCSESRSNVPLCHFLWDAASTSKHFFLTAGVWEAVRKCCNIILKHQFEIRLGHEITAVFIVKKKTICYLSLSN